VIVGIDLGTTNSLVSVFRDDSFEVIPNSLGDFLTPSVVGLDDEGQVLTGAAAKERLLTHPELTAANFKRLMGSSSEIKLGKKKFRPEELSSFILRALRLDAEAFLGDQVEEAIITVPAYFNDSQRKATKIAGELAGIRVARLLNEPTSAALAYGLHHEKECRYLVFDLGGGTFDVSIVEYFDQLVEVHASAGNNFLGGEDFTEVIYQHFARLCAQVLGRDAEALPPVLDKMLKFRAEQAKLLLSTQDQAALQQKWHDQVIDLTVTQDQFENWAGELVMKIETPIRQALRDSKMRAGDLDEIVLVGGATRMPLIRKLVTRLFRRFPSVQIDADKVVAAGAAIQTGLMQKHAALEDVVMTDVSPYTLGVEISRQVGDRYADGHFMPIIERNSFIPVSRVETVCTVSDYQPKIEVRIYQGENPMVKDNIFLGSLTVDVPRKKRGEEEIDIRFTYDINGLLEVEVEVKSTGKKSSILIEENPGVLSKEEIASRFKQLEKLKIHPRDQIPNQALINKANRLYQENLGATRDYISELLANFDAILSRQDEREIREAREQLGEILNQIEEDPLAQ